MRTAATKSYKAAIATVVIKVVQKGAGKYREISEEAYASLAGDFAIDRLDQRKNLPNRFSASDMAHDAYEALCALGLGRVRLFGISMGGMVALRLALDHPGSVRKLALSEMNSNVLR